MTNYIFNFYNFLIKWKRMYVCRYVLIYITNVISIKYIANIWMRRQGFHYHLLIIWNEKCLARVKLVDKLNTMICRYSNTPNICASYYQKPESDQLLSGDCLNVWTIIKCQCWSLLTEEIAEISPNWAPLRTKIAKTNFLI